MLTEVSKGLGSKTGEDMDVFKCIVPLRLGSTLNSHRAASPLVRLVEGTLSETTPIKTECTLFERIEEILRNIESLSLADVEGVERKEGLLVYSRVLVILDGRRPFQDHPLGQDIVKGENASQVADIVKGFYGADTVIANYVQFCFRRFRSEFYCQQLERLNLAIDQKWQELANRRGGVFHQNTARPRPFVVTHQRLWRA
ncbi:hypothetical protein TNCV_4259811 [Trichonephila clavipes]|nr:hypothetical protein TNCV_4259811 [Trichonephila clavipes]